MPEPPFKRLEHAFEFVLWRSRLIVLVAVVSSMLIAAGAIYMATIDAFYTLGYLTDYASPRLTSQARAETRTHAITAIVKCVDGYLIGAIMVIFSIGLYELFINRIRRTEVSDSEPRLLRIRSLDDLKDRLAKVVLLLLTIEFFQFAMQMNFKSTLELLYLAVGIVLLAGALYLTNTRDETP